MRRDDAYRALAIGVSSGGIDALRRLLPAIAPSCRWSILIVIHTASESATGLCEILQPFCALPLREAGMGEPALPANAYLAPPGYHLLIERDERFALSVDDKVCFVRPSADVLFESAADVWSRRLIAVVLTGANDDGARGLKAVRDCGGLAIVQAPEDAQMPAMPQAALAIAGADHVLGLAQMGPLLNYLAMRESTDS